MKMKKSYLKKNFFAGSDSLLVRAAMPAINLPNVFYNLGSLLFVESLFMLIPLSVCIILGESDWKAFAVGAGVTACCAFLLKFLTKGRNPRFGRRDGCLLTALVWVAFSALGMIPFLICATPLNVSEGFFEAMSGFTTTGATVIRDVELCSHGILLWRGLTQWLGGLGIVLFTIAIIPSLNSTGGLSMFNAEVSGITHDKLGSRIADTAKILWGLYLALTMVLVGLLWAGPMSLFDAVCHALSTISTGGYSTHSDGIAGYGSAYLKIVLTIFMFIAGVNFSLLYATFRGHWRSLTRNDVFRAYLLFILLNFLVVAPTILLRGHYDGWQSITVDPLFHIVSAITSTGLGAGNFEAWGPLVVVLTIIMMYVGACAGSTTGGAKIDRILYLLKSFRVEVKRAIRPRSVLPVSVNGQYVSEEKGHEIVAFLMIFTALTVFGGLVLSAMDFPVGDSFFAAFSCTANNGLGAGMTGISGSYDFLPDAGKWVMSFLMLAGRLEVFTVIIIFTPSFWKK